MLFLTALTCLSFAQEGVNKEFRKQFNDFKTEITAEQDTFKKTNDSLFAAFLKDSWKSFDLFYNEKISRPKPSQQPILDSAVLKYQPQPQKNMLKGQNPEVSNDGEGKMPMYTPEESLQLMFYGTALTITEAEFKKPSIEGITEKDITSYFNKASENNELNAVIGSLHEKAIEMNLNDWGLLDIHKKVAQKLYSDVNDRIMYIWYALLKAGLNIKIGYNDSHVFLLIPSNREIYNTWYFELDDRIYYLVDIYKKAANLNSLYSHEANYPDSKKSFDLLISRMPDFYQDPVKVLISHQDTALPVELNSNLVGFYNNYPDCDLYVHFTAPVSENIFKPFDQYFNKLLKDRSEPEKINILLNFVQGMPYMTDMEQFGMEKYMFHDQTLWYRYSDCEDRAVLLAKLIERYTGLETIGLDYPEHISLAVRLNNDIHGDYVVHGSVNYYISDPTYIGARVGMSIPAYKNVKPKIIETK